MIELHFSSFSCLSGQKIFSIEPTVQPAMEWGTKSVYRDYVGTRAFQAPCGSNLTILNDLKVVTFWSLLFCRVGI